MSPTTRERILDVAARLFNDHGYDGTSLRQIADEMGFTKAALYYHFQSKEDILRALVEPLLVIQNEILERITAAATMDDWADVMEWAVDIMLANVRSLTLLDRNQAPLEVLAVDWDFVQDHQRWHDRIEDAIASHDRTFDERVRITAAFGAMAGFDDFGKRLITEVDTAVLRDQLVGTLRGLLGVPVKKRAVKAAG